MPLLINIGSHNWQSLIHVLLLINPSSQLFIHQLPIQTYVIFFQGNVKLISHQNTTRSGANQNPFRSGANQNPFRSGANQNPFRSGANQNPFRSEANQNPFRSGANQNPFRSGANQYADDQNAKRLTKIIVPRSQSEGWPALSSWWCAVGGLFHTTGFVEPAWGLWNDVKPRTKSRLQLTAASETAWYPRGGVLRTTS